MCARARAALLHPTPSHLFNTFLILWRTLEEEEGADMLFLLLPAPLPSGGRFSIVATTWLGCCCCCCSGGIIAVGLAIRSEQQGASCAARPPKRESRGRSRGGARGGGCGDLRVAPRGSSSSRTPQRCSAMGRGTGSPSWRLWSPRLLRRRRWRQQQVSASRRV